MSDFNSNKKHLDYLWLLADHVLEDIRSRALENPGSELLTAIDAELEFRRERRRQILDWCRSREELGLDPEPGPLATPLSENPPDIPDKTDHEA